MRTVAEPSASGIENVNQGETTWYSINRAGPSEYRFLEDRFAFHPLDLADSRAKSGRSKLVERSSYLFFIMPFPVYRPNSDMIQTSSLRVFLSSRDLVTLHDGYLGPVGKIFGECATNAESSKNYMGRGASHLLCVILDRLIDSCFPVIFRFGERIARVEESVLAGPTLRSIIGISVLRRDGVGLRRIVASQPQIISGLERARLSNAQEDMPGYWRDLFNRTSLLREMTEDHREMIAGLVAASNLLTNYRNNVAIRLVSIVLVIALPLALVSGFWRMNFERLPLSDTHFGFEMVVVLMIVLGAGLLVYLRLRRWF